MGLSWLPVDVKQQQCVWVFVSYGFVWVFSIFGSYYLAVVGTTNLRLKLLRFRAQRTNFPRARGDGKHNITSTRPNTAIGVGHFHARLPPN